MIPLPRPRPRAEPKHSTEPRHSAGQRRPRRAKLRTRVLAGVLLITMTALVAFDISAVSALRRYLLSHTGAQLTSVLRLYRPLTRPGPMTVVPGVAYFGRGAQINAVAARPAPRNFKQITGTPIAGPQVRIAPPIFDQYFLEFVRGRSGQRVLVAGNPDLRPRVVNWVTRNQWTRTVPSRNGRAQLLMQAVHIGGGTLVATTSLAEVNKTVGRLRLILIIGSAVAALLVGLGVAFVVRRGLRPIETMATQADLITAGDLTERVGPQDAASEVGRLSTALNDMLARIDASIKEREATQELTRRFFADASHELRNPLASLRANAELYQQGVLRDSGQVDEAMRRIAHEAQRMSGLVDDMLRLARLDQHPEQRDDLVDLSALVAACAQRARAADPARIWRCDVAPGLVTTGDEELLRRAIDNLLANCRLHTPAGSRASISASSVDGTITVAITDDGPGVPACELPRIFDRFYRGGHARQPGSGLGLAIVAAIAAAHRGAVRAEPADPHGLRVALTLPECGPFPLIADLDDADDGRPLPEPVSVA